MFLTTDSGEWLETTVARTTSKEVNNLVEHSASHCRDTIPEIVQVVESVVGRLTAHRRKKLTAKLWPLLRQFGGEQWSLGVRAEREKISHESGKGQKKNAARDQFILQTITTQRDQGLTLEEAAYALADSDVCKGMTAESIIKAYQRAKPRPK